MIPKALHAQRVIVRNRPVLPVIEGEGAPGASTEAEPTQMYLKTSAPEALYMCVGADGEGTRWRRIAFGR